MITKVSYTAITAPTGFPPRAWTEKEKHDVIKVMRAIVDKEKQGNTDGN